MGMEQRVEFGAEGCPAWPAIADLLATSKFPVQIRMIDGELAFPDETPPEEWRELRIGTAAGMVTVRRGPAGVDLVTWGNADPAMLEAWNALTWAFAAGSRGCVLTPEGRLSAEDYRQRQSMPPELGPPQ